VVDDDQVATPNGFIIHPTTTAIVPETALSFDNLTGVNQNNFGWISEILTI
jgi:hypothetical protein